METPQTKPLWSKPPGRLLAVKEYESIVLSLHAECEASFDYTIAQSGGDLLLEVQSGGFEVIAVSDRVTSSKEIFQTIRAAPRKNRIPIVILVNSKNQSGIYFRDALPSETSIILSHGLAKRYLKTYLVGALCLQACFPKTIPRVTARDRAVIAANLLRQFRTDEMQSAVSRFSEIQQSAALTIKDANDAIQVALLASESAHFKPLISQNDWQDFHSQCMQNILRSMERLQRDLEDLKSKAKIGELPNAAFWDLVQAK